MQNRKDSNCNKLFCSSRDGVGFSLNLIPVGSRAARVSFSDIRNKFWCNIITVLVIVLSLCIPFKQCTLLIQHKRHKTNANGFGLRTSFYLCCKRTNPLMQKCMSSTTGKRNLFSAKSSQSTRQSL